jgi:predicted permease
MLVVGEVALGVILLVAAGLLVRSFLYLRGLDPGFDPSHVTTATISLQDARYVQATAVQRLFSDSLDRIRRQPGVESAGVSLGLPYTRLLNMGFRRIEGFTDENKGGMTNVSYVTPGYFEALRVPLRAGRLFTDADQAGSLPVAIVNEQFAARFYKDRDIRGLHIRVADAEREVIGVIGNARATSSGLGGDNGPLPLPAIVYVPAAQVSGGFFKGVHIWFSPAWVIRSSGPVEGLPRQIREAIGSVDPLLPIARLETMTDVQADALARQRFMMSLVVGLGAVALLLAAIGIHGLIASSVSERRRELGIRLALGATSSQVIGGVVVPGLKLAVAGVLVGSAGAFATVSLLRSFLFGVTESDPLTFIAVVSTLLVVALLASLIPALRVLRLDPALTLRAD